MGFIIKYGNEEYKDFVNGTVNLKYSSDGSSFRFTGVYDHEQELHKKLFKPLAYPTITIWNTEGLKLITGKILQTQFKNDSSKRTVVFNGASITSVLGDCPIPLESYPLEFNGLSLKQIAEKLLEPFGLKVVIGNDDGKASEVIEEIIASDNQSVFNFLVEIASQRNLIITHNSSGNLVITKTLTNIRSIATYREEIPAVSIDLSVNGQEMHSEISANSEVDLYSDNAAESTIENPLVNDYRPLVTNQTVGDNETVLDKIKNIRSKELKNIKVVINSDRWEWLNSYQNDRVEIASPNNIVDVIGPQIFIPNRTPFFVEEVVLFVDSERETSVLTCVLPEVYNGENPKQIFG